MIDLATRRPNHAQRGAAFCRLLRPVPAAVVAVFCLMLAGPALALAQADHLENRERIEQPVAEPLELGMADQNFLNFALERARVSRQALEIGLQRAQSPELRVLAESMHEEQLAMIEALLELAGRDLQATATEMQGYDELAELRTLPPEAFDARFLDVLHALNRRTLPRYQAASNDGQLDDRVRALANEATPVLELHLELIGEVEQLYAGRD
jgi:predicted outer membrane protein